MQSILSELQILRNNRPIEPDRNNKNKYCIISNDSTHKTAYCFGVPIYNSNGKLLDLCFKEHEQSLSYYGSNAHINIDKIITFSNPMGLFSMDLFNGNIIRKSAHSVQYKNTELTPTVNGLLIKKECNNETSMRIKLTSSTPSSSSCWINDRCFCFMRNDFEPFITLSCIGASVDGKHISNPIKISFTQINDYEYILEFINNNPMTKYISFEINMYEKKLFQDTTVESSHPLLNNVYGTTAFIGVTSLLGEQWLYSRIDLSLISEFYNRKVDKVIMHIPTHNPGYTDFHAYNVSRRFCSFGSTWNDRIPDDMNIANAQLNNGYYSIDISNQIIDSKSKHMKMTEGVILKPKSKNGGFAVLSTGDCSFAPQILEICYR